MSPTPPAAGGGHHHEKKNRPKNTAIKQQRLAAWQPTYGPISTVLCLAVVAAAFIPLGAMMFVESRNFTRVEERYDDIPEIADCPWWNTKDHSFDRCLGTDADNKTCYPEGNPECANQQYCGQIANLAPHCPREFTAEARRNMSTEQLRNLSDCDPHCKGSLPFTITETLSAPVYLYYKLTSFNQNHRSFVDSRSGAQLAGDGNMLTGDCKPLLNPGGRSTSADDEYCLLATKDTIGEGEVGECHEIPLDYGDDVDTIGELMYAPCGLPAWSTYNDTLSVSQKLNDSSQVLICDGGADGRDEYMNDYNSDIETKVVPNVTDFCRKDHIAWKIDRDEKFRKPDLSSGKMFTYQGLSQSDYSTKYDFVDPFIMYGWYFGEPYHRLPAQTDEDFMVWSRIEMMSTFQKLYRIIDVDLEPGTYVLDVKHRFDVTRFGGEKYFILATANWTGANAIVFALLILLMGVTAFVACVVFMVLHLVTLKDRASTLEKWRQEAELRVERYNH